METASSHRQGEDLANSTHGAIDLIFGEFNVSPRKCLLNYAALYNKDSLI